MKKFSKNTCIMFNIGLYYQLALEGVECYQTSKYINPINKGGKYHEISTIIGQGCGKKA